MRASSSAVGYTAIRFRWSDASRLADQAHFLASISVESVLDPMLVNARATTERRHCRDDRRCANALRLRSWNIETSSIPISSTCSIEMEFAFAERHSQFVLRRSPSSTRVVAGSWGRDKEIYDILRARSHRLTRIAPTLVLGSISASPAFT